MTTPDCCTVWELMVVLQLGTRVVVVVVSPVVGADVLHLLSQLEGVHSQFPFWHDTEHEEETPHPDNNRLNRAMAAASKTLFIFT